MKIAFIVSHFPRLSETFILNQITGLIDLGHEVDIFAFSRSNEEKIHSDVLKYHLLRKTTFFSELPQGKTERILRAAKILLRYFIFYPKEITRCLNYTKWGSKYSALNNLFRLALFLKNKYYIIHCHFGSNAAHAIFLKEILGKRVKYITTFHGYDISRTIFKKQNEIYKKLFRIGDLFLPISNLWKERLERLGCHNEKIIVHRMGVDTEKNKFREISIGSDGINIITVARLVEKKGLEYSIPAVVKLIKKYPKLHYFIVGEGHLREKLQNLILQSDAGDKIRILGQLESDGVRKLLSTADIFLLASVTSEDGDQEGIPVSLMEAMATGVPVISTFHSGIPELVRNEESGFLVPEKDIAGIVEKIELLINDTGLRRKFAQAGRRIVERDFNIKTLNRRLIDIYANTERH